MVGYAKKSKPYRMTFTYDNRMNEDWKFCYEVKGLDFKERCSVYLIKPDSYVKHYPLIIGRLRENRRSNIDQGETDRSSNTFVSGLKVFLLQTRGSLDHKDVFFYIKASVNVTTKRMRRSVLAHTNAKGDFSCMYIVKRQGQIMVGRGQQGP